MSIRRTGQAKQAGRHDAPRGGWLKLIVLLLLLLSLAQSWLLLKMDRRLSLLESAGVEKAQPLSLEASSQPVPEAGVIAEEPSPASQTEALTKPEESSEEQTAAEPVVEEVLDLTPEKPVVDPWQPLSTNARPTIRLQIQNGVGEAGLAKRYGDKLQRLGYDIREKVNARSRLEKTLILERRGNERAAQRLAEDLGLGADAIRHEPDARLVDVDISLVLGRDYRSLKLPN